MSLLNIRHALEKRLSTLSPAMRTAYENTTFTPPTGGFQAVAMLPARPANPTMGPAHRRENGVFQVSVNYPANAGSKEATERALLIQAHFPRGLTLTESGVTVVIDRTPSISPARMPEGRYELSVSVFYFADIYG